MPETFGPRWRLGAAALLVIVAAGIVWLPYALFARSHLVWVIHLVLPSALVMDSLCLAAWAFLPVDQAVASAVGVYFAFGFTLSVTEASLTGTPWLGRASLLAMAAWPSLVLIVLGRWMAWVPLPE